jgi:Na+-translocating ferredoxin:NAD+ oxidoreductase subunit D
MLVSDRLKEFSWMTKNALMTYTFFALVILSAVSSLAWWPTSVVLSIIAVVTAVVLDYVLSLIMQAKGPLNTLSAAVFGLIVGLSYTLAVANPSSWVFTIHLTQVHFPELLPMEAPLAYAFVAAIAAVGMILFKKGQGLLGRKYVNPAAAAKLVVLLPFLKQVLLPAAHPESISLTGPINYGFHASVTGSNVLFDFFGPLVQACLGNTTSLPRTGVLPIDLFKTLVFLKYHSWVGGASSIAVILVGLGFFIVARKYVKWRITLSYMTAVTALSLVMYGIYGGDALLRISFELFIGRSIFLAFFMATDPATTPLTYLGQIIFGVGLGVLTVLIQMYMSFLGGSILALVIMNLTSPLLDKVGVPKPTETKKKMKLPKAKQFADVQTASCIRCGVCMRVCGHKLSPILLKEAFVKGDTEALKRLRVDFCDGCGHCTFVCPSRIDLRGFILRAKASVFTKH